MGDMKFTGSDLTRLQCAFIDTPEVEKLCEEIGQIHIHKHIFYQNLFLKMNQHQWVQIRRERWFI